MKQTVEEAANDYLNRILESTDFEINFEEDNYDSGARDATLDVTERAFVSGAEWHAKQSPWISVNQYPPMDKPLLLKYGDGGIDDMDLGFYTGLHYLTKDGQEVDKHVIEWMVL